MKQKPQHRIPRKLGSSIYPKLGALASRLCIAEPTKSGSILLQFPQKLPESEPLSRCKGKPVAMTGSQGETKEKKERDPDTLSTVNRP